MNLGGNDPCPCGSGKKYKKCCFDKRGDNTGVDNMQAIMAEVRSRLESGRFASLEEVQARLDSFMRRKNTEPCDDFHGLSPRQMHRFLHFPFESETLIEIKEQLESMALLDKVAITDSGKFTTIDLSAGQKKRLALVCALLEGRDVYLFDEIAADFDPEFRDFFYRTLLKELQAAGATVLAISHDDRYFDVADRVIVMDKGIIINGNNSVSSGE
ncbi:MAG: SEC-C domain-containing protein [Desulfofustis sp.]|nr:SEC-C domain-containing protein [Desulfofustis sp.]